MNFSTGIKTREKAVKLIDDLLPDVADDVIAKQNEAQKAHSIRENELAAEAKETARKMVLQLPDSVQIVNVEMRTSAGPTEMISVRLVKH